VTATTGRPNSNCDGPPPFDAIKATGSFSRRTQNAKGVRKKPLSLNWRGRTMQRLPIAGLNALPKTIHEIQKLGGV
jgi:hypothetical protein